MKTALPLLPTRFLRGAFQCRHRGCGRRFTGVELRSSVAHHAGGGRYAAEGVFGLPGPVAVFAPCGHEQTSFAPQIIRAEAPALLEARP